MTDTGTQQVEGTVSAPESFLPGSNRTAPPPTPPAAAPETKAADTTPPAASAATSAAPAKEVAPAATAATADPYELAVQEEEKGVATPIAWDDSAKGVFKSTFGADDPLTYKQQIDTRLAEADLVKGEYEKLLPFKQQFENTPPAIKRAFQLVMEGKAEQAQEFLRDLPTGVFMNREAKNIPSDKLIETYLPDKMSHEERETMNDPDTDPDIVKTLKTKEKYLRDIAADMHERKRLEVVEQAKASDQSRATAWENFTRGAAESIAHAKNGRMKTFIDPSFTDEISTGKFIQRFVREDGFTPTKEAAEMLAWALHGEKLGEAKYKAGVARGRSEARLEATAGLPGAPPSGGRQTGGTPTPQTEQTLKENIFERLGRSAT